MSFGILAVLGLAVFGGLIGAVLFQKIRFPQVIGYIIIGLIIGRTGLGWVTERDVIQLKQVNMVALGIIGFLVGSELKLEIFRKYAKQFTAILMLEGCLAFLLVGAAVTIVIQLLTGNFKIAVATGIVFGAIASATDPASTMDVIWEYRAAGAVTTATIAVIALDDALAMTLYGIGTGFSQMLTAGDSAGVVHSLLHVFYELGVSLVAGGLLAVVLVLLLRWIKQVERGVALSVGMILFALGVAARYRLDVILVTMSIGFVMVNLLPRQSEAIFKQLRSFAVPLYVLFFVLVGAKLDVTKMPLWLWGVVALYVIFRNAGKIFGCYLGAKWSHSPESVCKYMGFGLFAQGGVAIGLSIVAGEYLTGIQVTPGLALSDMIVYVVTATTLVLQLSGPPMVKMALKLSKEAGRNVTEEDVLAEVAIKDAVTDTASPCKETDTVAEAVEYFAASDYPICPVVDREGRVCGLLSFESLKEVLNERESWNWLLVADVMIPLGEYVTAHQKLAEAADLMKQYQLEVLPVIDDGDHRRPCGVLTNLDIRKAIQARMLAQ